MIRNLKALTLALVAVAALGAVAASGAQAAAKFTAPGAGAATTTVTSTTDGTGKQAHAVFDVQNGTTQLSITCPEIKATNTSVVGEEAASVTTTLDFTGITGEQCKFAGQNVTVNTGACDFVFFATGAVEIAQDTKLTGECTHTMQPIVFEITGCKVEVGAQNLVAGSVAYTNINTNQEITVSTPGAGGTGIPVVVNATGANCNFGTGNFGTFTTGNTILTGERGGAMAAVKWDAT